MNIQETETNSTTLALRYWKDPLLTMVCSPVRESEFGPKLELFADRLVTAMQTLNGVGLAAAQLGVPIRMFVMCFPEAMGMKRPTEPRVICNPTLELSGPMDYGQEGCLSMPSIYSQVPRARIVHMRYFTPLGVEQELNLNQMDARVAAHEEDHLNGIMFINRLPRQMKRAAEREWDKVKHRYK